jgi:S1-C subfamily serine protease
MSNILRELNHDVAQWSARVQDALVQIHNHRRSAGSGAIWHSDGLILTNAHVILNAQGQVSPSLAVTLRDGRELPAQLLAHDKSLDLAALRIDATNLPTIELGDSRALQPGHLVLALGFPWGIKAGATAGVVIATGANLPELGDAPREWIAAALHLRPGHSGGPMVDSRGRLIGINTLMNGPEVGVAIPVHVAVDFLDAALGPQRAPIPGTAAVVYL